jgi:hypothetical protein
VWVPANTSVKTSTTRSIQDQRGLSRTAAQVARGYMSVNDHGNWWGQCVILCRPRLQLGDRSYLPVSWLTFCQPLSVDLNIVQDTSQNQTGFK